MPTWQPDSQMASTCLPLSWQPSPRPKHGPIIAQHGFKWTKHDPTWVKHSFIVQLYNYEVEWFAGEEPGVCRMFPFCLTKWTHLMLLTSQALVWCPFKNCRSTHWNWNKGQPFLYYVNVCGGYFRVTWGLSSAVGVTLVVKCYCYSVVGMAGQSARCRIGVV